MFVSDLILTFPLCLCFPLHPPPHTTLCFVGPLCILAPDHPAFACFTALTGTRPRQRPAPHVDLATRAGCCVYIPFSPSCLALQRRETEYLGHGLGNNLSLQ